MLDIEFNYSLPPKATRATRVLYKSFFLFVLIKVVCKFSQKKKKTFTDELLLIENVDQSEGTVTSEKTKFSTIFRILRQISKVRNKFENSRKNYFLHEMMK